MSVFDDHLELVYEVAAGKWTEGGTLRDRDLISPQLMVSEVFTRLGVAPERIAAEVFLASLAHPYTPDNILAAIRSAARSTDARSRRT